ncbi:S8 family serine peptidase [bacterium]|nr:S8 family serine peptidase [bacterium]
MSEDGRGRWARGWMVGALLGLLLGLSAWGQPDGRAGKVSPEIHFHQREKAALLGLPRGEARARLSALGIAGPELLAEDCGLYVSSPLSEVEIAQLAASGIVISRSNYVPPVPGRHPRGFYLARVRYSALPLVEADARILSLVSAEYQSCPKNDLGAVMINADDVHAGAGVTARTGAGIKIAVADSGLDLTHPDIPTPAEAYDMTDGTDPASWGTDVTNLVTPHGTHVTGTVLGRGTQSGGQYKGAAPGATLHFYKIGDDSTAGAAAADEIEAVNRALATGCRIFTMSYGGYDTFMDGSSLTCQAIDAAVSAGMAVFISAGNARPPRRTTPRSRWRPAPPRA